MDTIEELKGMGLPSTLSLGFSCSTRPMRLQTLSSGRSSDDARFGSDGPLYSHIGHVLSANGVTRRRYRVWNTRTPLRPRLTSFRSSSSMTPTLCFSFFAQPHDQLSCFSGLPPVNNGNDAAAGFLM